MFDVHEVSSAYPIVIYVAGHAIKYSSEGKRIYALTQFLQTKKCFNKRSASLTMSILKPKHTNQGILWQRKSKQLAYAWKTKRTSRKLHEILFATTCDMLGFVQSTARPSPDSQTFPKPQV